MATKLTGIGADGLPTTSGDTGIMEVDGSLTIGNADTDNVIFNADISSDVIPNADTAYSLGSSTKQWRNVFAGNFEGNGSNLTGVESDPGGNPDQLQFNNSGSLDGTGTLYYKNGMLGIGDYSSANPSYILSIKGNHGGGQTPAILEMEDYTFPPTVVLNRSNGNSQSPSGVSD